MSTTKIEWTDAVWNPVTGCTKVSAGCKNCYAERLAKGRLSHLPEYDKGFTNVVCHQDRLDKPKQWKKPRKIFVNSMSDLFHEDVSFDFIYEVFKVMKQCPQHIFQILTKRPERMLRFYEAEKKYPKLDWPLPNVWIGVSVEDQETANERIPLLLQMPAAIRFLSCEPLLGPIDLTEIKLPKEFGEFPNEYYINCLTTLDDEHYYSHHNKINWIIIGGESGPNARPMHPDWIRSIINQCKPEDVAFFFKQWGEFAPHNDGLNVKKIGITHNGIGYDMCKVGKKKAGCLLDGVEYKEFTKY